MTPRDKPLIRILGPIDAVTADGPTSLGGRQPRAVLGALVVGAGHAVRTDHLRWVLWGDEEPSAGDATLQSYISHLRHVLGPHALVAIDHSYELDLAHVAIDAVDFEHMVRLASDLRDSPADCLSLCRDAMALWRGPAFGDLTDDAAFAIEVRRLEELRLAAIELRLEADIALGHGELVVGELRGAVTEYPYREHLWLLLIWALASAERRVEALRVCREVRGLLGDVGLGASPELAEIERRLLDGAPIDQASLRRAASSGPAG